MATYKPIRKTANGTEEIKIPYAVLADPPTIPAAVTSINGLSGGTLTSPMTLTGGDSATASKIILSSNGQITDSGTATMLGFSGGNYIVGSANYPTTFRGKQTRPTWNGKDLALHSDIPAAVTESTVSGWGFTKNTGTVTSVAVKMNGATKGTVTSSGTIDLGTVITADGGTINKSKTVKMDASANSNGANLKWGTVNSKNPYIGYASDQTDGTFVVGSLLGTNYASGLAIGGGSGNLLWKGAKVATTSDIPNISGKLDKAAFSLSGTTLTITV